MNNEKRILFISEVFSKPFDEGIKNVALSLYKELNTKSELLAVTKTENDVGDLDIKKVPLNKFFLNNLLRRIIRDYSPHVILYLPETSITFNSFLRAKSLKFMNKSSKVAIFGILHRDYSLLQRFIIRRFLRPDLVLLFGRFRKDFFIKDDIDFRILPPAVDTAKFSPPTDEQKRQIRKKYDIPMEIKVVLHIGHIRKTRNLEPLIDIQKSGGIQVVIVGSTSTPRDTELKGLLLRAGVRVIDEYVADISEMYKMSDIYVFPVRNEIASINLPLSILEAMACNLPVVTTRFGALADYFRENAGFRYFDTPEKLVEIISSMNNIVTLNNKKIETFTWERLADNVINVCNELV